MKCTVIVLCITFFCCILPAHVPEVEEVFHIAFEHQEKPVDQYVYQSSLVKKINSQACTSFEARERNEDYITQKRLYECYQYGIDPIWADPNAHRVALRCTMINFLNGPLYSPQYKNASALPPNFYDIFPGQFWQFLGEFFGTYGGDYEQNFKRRVSSCSTELERQRYERAEMRRWEQYKYSDFQTFLKKLSVYDDYMLEIAAQLKHDPEFAELLTGVNKKLPQYITNEVEWIQDKRMCAAFKEVEKDTQSHIETSFIAQIPQLMDECAGYPEVKKIYQEHNLPHENRFEQRAAAFNEIATGKSEYRKNYYELDTTSENGLNTLGIHSSAYRTCYGNQLQQLIHGECIQLLQQATGLTENSELYEYKNPLIICIDAGREYNQAGSTFKALSIVDLCWTILDCGAAVIEGAMLGLKSAVGDLASHPVTTAACVVAGTYVFAYQLSKIAYSAAKIGTLAVFDRNAAANEWNTYTAPIQELFRVITENELKTRDIIKGTTQVATHLLIQHKIFNALGTFRTIAQTKFVEITEKHQLFAFQEHAVTPDGVVVKAT